MDGFTYVIRVKGYAEAQWGDVPVDLEAGAGS